MQALLVELDLQEKSILHKIVRSKTLGSSLKERARIVLAASEGLTNRQIVREHDIEEHRVGIWRRRWHEKHEAWKKLDPELRPKMSEKLVCRWLADAKGRGIKPKITEEQRALILALACEPPEQSGYTQNGQKLSSLETASPATTGVCVRPKATLHTVYGISPHALDGSAAGRRSHQTRNC